MAGARNRYLNITTAQNSKAAKAYAGRHVKTSPPNAGATKAAKSVLLTDSVTPRYYTSDVEAQVSALFKAGKLSKFDTRDMLFNFLLPRGVVLVDGFRPGAVRHKHETEAEHDRRRGGLVMVKEEAADSRHGLGGFHGSSM